MICSFNFIIYLRLDIYPDIWLTFDLSNTGLSFEIVSLIVVKLIMIRSKKVKTFSIFLRRTVVASIWGM